MSEQAAPLRTRPTVLVIDPSASNRALICECLGQLPEVRTMATGDGNHALQMVRETWPSLILLDTTQQDINGIELTRMIRDWELSRIDTGISPWTPIVFLSSVTDEDTLAQGILAGGDDFLCKPVSEVVLLAKVRAMLRISIRQQEICEIHRQLKEIANLDGLTGIPNRRHFDDTLTIEWKRCIRNETPLSIILSEEFVAILPGTDANGAYAVAERMRQSAVDLCIPHERGINGRVSCSFGVASTHPSTESAPQHLLKTADTSLYAAKSAGRNRVILNIE